MDLGHPFKVISSSVDGSVLTVLAKADEAFTPPRVHELAGQYSEDGIRKALERLTRQGIVISNRVGNATNYRLNRCHLAAEPIIAIANLRGQFITQLQDEIRSWNPPPPYAALFGSAARSAMRVDSDIDIFIVRPDAIEVDDSQWMKQTETLTVNAYTWTGNNVHILEFSESETADNLAMDDPVLTDIATEGITLSGPRRYLTSRKRQAHGTD